MEETGKGEKGKKLTKRDRTKTGGGKTGKQG